MRNYQIAGAGIVLVILGAIGPWVKVADISEGGLDADGVITLILGLIAAAFVVLAFRKRAAPNMFAIGIPAVLIVVIAIADISDVNGADLGVPGLDASVGWGLWLTLVGGIVLAASVAMGLMRKR